jgi:hypothetical protein
MTCMLITFAMQLTCAFENKLTCTDNETLAQLLYVPSCQVLVLDVIPPLRALHRIHPELP